MALMPTLSVIWCPNPLRPASDRKVLPVALVGTETLQDIVQRLGLADTPLAIMHNGRPLAAEDWAATPVSVSDLIVIHQVAKGIVEGSTVAAKLVMYGEIGWTAAFALGTVAAFAANAVIAFAISALAGSLATKRPGASQGDNAPTAYSIEGGSNSARNYEPLQLVLGEHRVFPDYAGRPFGEYVLDPSTATEVINNTPAFEDRTNPPFGFSGSAVIAPWVLIASSNTVEYYGDQAERTYTRSQSGMMPGGTIAQPHTFVVRREGPLNTVTTYEEYLATEVTWHPIDQPLPVIWRYGYTAIYKTERVTSIFNYGFGDLSISDERLGANSVDQYNSIELHSSLVPPGQPDRTVLHGYSSDGWLTDVYPGNVQTVDGGALEQRASVENNGWVERQGSQPGSFIQMDISGRLLHQGGGGFENLSCVVAAEYQPPGSGDWLAMPFSPMRLTNGSTRPLRETFSAWLPQPAAKFRVRRVTGEYTDASDVAEIEWTRLKIFRDVDALYPAQLRRGMTVKATGQLNGRIDRYSAFLRHKCWVWNSSAPWDGSMPAVGAGAWQWTYSTNPAWLFLYFSRGGFLNPTAAPAHMGQAGWLDEPSASNGERLFGAGLPNARIDYGTLVAWGQYCAVAQLTCRMLLSGARSAGTVLDDIAAAGRARKTWAPGKLSVWWERDGQPWVAAFGASNIIAGTFKVAYITDDTVDEFGLSYSQSDNDYEADTVYAKVPGVTLPVNQQVSQATYSMPKAQAQRLVNLLAASKHYHRRTITWESSIMGLTVATGDIIQLGHDLTRWAFSGRLVDLSLTGARVAWVDLSAEVELPDGNDFYLMVTPPGGDPFSVRCAKPVGRTRRLTLVGNWPASAAPGWLDAGTPNPQASAEWEDTLPEDWTFLGGPQQTPGKRVRIISMEPSSSRRVRMTVRDEYEQYYPLEWGLGVVPGVASGERRVARAFNLSAAPLPDGGTRLAWELEAAHGADVRVSVNGGPSQQVPVAGHITVLGRELLLPPYPAGTRLAVSLLPVTAGAPISIEGDTLEVQL